MADILIQGTTIIEDKRRESGRIWSVTGAAWTGSNPASNALTFNNANGEMTATSDDENPVCSVNLPNGSIINNVVVYGDAAAAAGVTWSLVRIDHSGGSETLASASVNTEDTSISNEIVNNDAYAYLIVFGANQFDTSDTIYGARIRYE